MARDESKYGLLIDYEYCTGCHTCEVACAQANDWPAGMAGMKVMEVVEAVPNDRAYLVYLPFPTELCIPCAHRTVEGKKPACVAHCMEACLKHGRIADLAVEMKNKPHMVLWAPR